MSKPAIRCVLVSPTAHRGISKPAKPHSVVVMLAVTLAAFGLVGMILLAPVDSLAQPIKPAPAAAPAPLTNEQTQALVKRVLQTELEAARDAALSHPMQYKLRKQSPRLATTKLIVETKDGDVARLIAVNDIALQPTDRQKEDGRLQNLLDDPALQRHRQQREQGDAERARKVMRALPDAFLYSFSGIVDTPAGPSYRLSFQPNSSFDPEDLEAQVLKGVAGELWIDVAQQRVTRLEGERLHDVDYGWGILGKLDQGGTLLLEQADIGNRQWRTTHMVLIMNARVLLKTVKLDTTLELSQFTPVPSGLNYRQAIQMLRTRSASQASSTPSGR